MLYIKSKKAILKKTLVSSGIVLMLLMSYLYRWDRTTVSPDDTDEDRDLMERATVVEIKAHTKKQKPSGTLSDTHITKTYEELAAIKQDGQNQDVTRFIVLGEGVSQDEYGNSVIELAPAMDETKSVHIITESPLFFPKDFAESSSMDEQYSGCNLGGFYIDYQATLSVIHYEEDYLVMSHYMCDFSQGDSLGDAYYLQDIDDISTIQRAGAEALRQSILSNQD